MADVPGVVKYGKVTGYFVAYLADGVDAGTVPDEVPLTGSVTLEPLVRVTRWPTATPKRLAIAQTIEARVIAGVLCSPAGEPGVYLVATDQPQGQPTLIQWKATFKLANVPMQPQPVVFNVPEWNPADVSTAVDLAMVASVTPEPPVIAVITQADAEAAAQAAAAAQEAADAAQAAAAGAVNKASIAGDLAGTPTTPVVDGLQGRALAATAPTTGQALVWNGTTWGPGTVSGGGGASDLADLTGVSDDGKELIGTGTDYATMRSALGVQDASTTQKGQVELATPAETAAGTDTSRAVTPAGLAPQIGGVVRRHLCPGNVMVARPTTDPSVCVYWWKQTEPDGGGYPGAEAYDEWRPWDG